MMTGILLAAAALATAQIAHEVNRDYCLFLGDASQLPWDEAPEWQRTSAVNGVEFHVANPDADASASHESWMAEKVKEGWVYGETKDPEKKTHPCIVAFADLPKEQQLKDFLFRAVVHAAYPKFEAVITDADPDGVNDDLHARLVDAEGSADDAQAEIEDLKAKVATLEKDLAASKAKPKAAAVKDPAPKLRKFKLESRDANATPADEQARRDALREKIQGADDIEIVQIDADGKEIAGSQPIHVSGEVWRDHAIGLMLDKPVEFRGSDQVYKLAGFGLLIDGKQAGVQIRHEPVIVHAGQQVKLERDIAF